MIPYEITEAVKAIRVASPFTFHTCEGFETCCFGEILIAWARVEITELCEIGSVTEKLYTQLFELTQDYHLCRIWNAVPEINRIVDGMEVYQRFCKGRAAAFESTWNAQSERHMPAATAVGVTKPELFIGFIASKSMPTHFENALQTPAYRYPEAYGPKSPSFARATLAELENRRFFFVSGTASIRGSESLHRDDLYAQWETTRDNINALLRDSDIELQPSSKVWIQVFLRNPTDQASLADWLQSEWQTHNRQVYFYQAPICREELLVEIDLTLVL